MKKKSLLLGVLGVGIIAIAVSGTVAWLTRTSTLTNTFTVGTFESPTTDPIDPLKTISIDGNLYEPSWITEDEDGNEVVHKLLPGAVFDKDPYVGMGPESEDAVVYVKVENNISDKVYFEINDEWTAVEEYSTEYTTEAEGQNADNKKYVSGLFKYNNVLESLEDEDSWTTSLFDQVIVDDDANIDDFETDGNVIVVSSFLHQAKDSEGSDIPADTILETVVDEFYPQMDPLQQN